MSSLTIEKYHKEIQDIIDYGGTKKETAIRFAFHKLLDDYASQKGLKLVAEVSIKTSSGHTVTPDGTLKDSLRLDWGYWESKDEADDINLEIQKKFAKGYPKENILFEDSQTAVLFQNGIEVLRVNMKDGGLLDKIIKVFINYERPEVQSFRKAIELFKSDVPKVSDALKNLIHESAEINSDFIKLRDAFLETCKQSINPEISIDDINEMMIQHILTADIFNTIFDEPYFHRENNIAQQLESVINTFFTRNIRENLMTQINQYYQAINATAAGIIDHHEKQKFLKIVYETFYKAYNPKSADRLGVVYTPDEIVKFQIESIDYILQKHFDVLLSDKNVEILDPATGTGTYVCALIDYLPKDKLEYKYKNEIHANEVAILPYYIANLNIEFTYKQRMGKYEEFQNLCFVDTLDNMGFDYKNKQEDMFGISAKNTERIKRQNERKISVIVGNPPYNANQMNENDNNKNREYPIIDKRIKDTFINKSTAQKTKVYDMYSRFYRWAMDRIGDEGVICFITNNSFVNARTFDGFRKTIQEEFDYIYIVDLGGNIRELSGKDGIFLNEKNTIFGVAAAVGIAIMFLVKTKEKSKSRINYIHPCDIRATRDEKIDFINNHSFKNINFDLINPDKNNNWINLTDNDWDIMIPVIDKIDSIFHFSSLGVSTNRDEWVFDFDKNNLEIKMKYFIEIFNNCVNNNTINLNNINEKVDYSIKWSDSLKSKLLKRTKLIYNDKSILNYNYRPFIKKFYFSSKEFSDRLTENHFIIHGKELMQHNKTIVINQNGKDVKFFSSNILFDLHYLGDSQYLPLIRYTESGDRIYNITDWGLQQFHSNYNDTKMVKEDIFHYVYGVLHNPEYRKKYELNLKREFPRIPFYDDFWKWAKWGEKLMDLHINFETVEPYPLTINTIELDREVYKPKLKANKEEGKIELDNQTTISGIPKEAWDYKLGNRSGLEWILDQYKEKKPKDPTIAKMFNTYKFIDYKDKVIDLIMRVTTVSAETMKIIREMEGNV